MIGDIMAEFSWKAIVLSAVAVVVVAAIAAPVPALAKAPAARFTVNAAVGTVFDAYTKLTWQRGFGDLTYTWSAAKTYCKGLSLDGGGWRLPKLIELESIVDRAEKSPAIDQTVFPATPAIQFWSATPYAGSASSAWCVQFAVGNSFNNSVSNVYRARCVR